MINAILNGILSFASSLITLLLNPIDRFIDANIPSLSTILNNIGATFTFLTQTLGWVVDSFCLPNYAITFLILTITFRLNLRFAVNGIKLALHWWEKIIP